MKTRAQYAITIGAIDWGTRLAAFRAINGGWQSKIQKMTNFILKDFGDQLNIII
jgi:hypothetical protein